MTAAKIRDTAYILIILFLAIAGIYYSRQFLIPFTIALILAMLILPLAQKLEQMHISRPFASLISVLAMLVVIAGVIALLTWQMSGIIEDVSNIEQKANNMISQGMQWVNSHFGVSPQKQEAMLKGQQSSAAGGVSSLVMSVVGSLWSVVIDIIIIIVYMFLLLTSRYQLKMFVLKSVKTENRKTAERIVGESSKISQKYLGGLAVMIAMLWVMYGIGFSIVGIKHALFFAILCGTLELIPFIGNLTGTSLTVLMALSQGGGSSLVIGVLVTYSLVQFIQSYILQPLIVGSEVNINPLFTIIGLIVGEMIWGVAGMFLAIPVMGIVKIFCDNVDGLKPVGYLMGKEKTREKNSGFIKKVKSVFK